MTAKTRKKKKSAAGSSDGEVKKARRSRVEDDGADIAADDAEPMAARIEKSVEKRLRNTRAKVEKKTKPRKKASPRKKTQPRKPRARKADRIDEDSEVPVKNLWDSEDSTDSDVDIDRAIPGQKSLIEQILSFLPGAKAKDYDRLIDTLERMDEFGKVPDVDNKLEALMMFLYERYWRVETSGLEHIPDEGRTLIVSNHSGVLPFDGAMMATAIYKFHPARRHARFLIEDWFGQLPFATSFMNAVGQVRACQENAQRLLRQEQLVGVFPEGIKGMAKGFKDRYNIARFGRGGVIRLAIRTKSPVVPCAVVGAEEIYIVLGYANWLGKIFGMPLLPITPTFPWLGPLGVVPLPTKWYIQFGKIISYDEYDESALKDNVIINRLNRQLRATIQEMLDSMLKKRRSLFFG